MQQAKVIYQGKSKSGKKIIFRYPSEDDLLSAWEYINTLYFRGEGLGTTLMKTVLAEAKKNLNNLRIVTLGVFGNNQIARQLYQKMGFIEFGKLPKGIIHKGTLVDHIYMYKEV